jgi:uncharacterized protein YndB with AHSA1/START domain
MTGDPDVVRREIFIAAAPATVFAFLVDPALMAQWIGISHVLEARPGGVFRVEVSRGNVARGIYVEVIPYRRVAFTWGWESQDPALAALAPGISLIEIDLEPRDGGTLLRLRHSGLPESLKKIHGERWSHYLTRLEEAAVEPEGKHKLD